MSAFSDSIEDDFLDYIFKVGAFTAPTVLGVALLTTLAIDSDPGTFPGGTGAEVTHAGAYARVAHAPGGNWTSAGTPPIGSTTNVGSISFPQASAAWPGPLLGLAICDTITHDAGAMLFHSELTDQTITVGLNSTFTLPAGAIVISLD